MGKTIHAEGYNARLFKAGSLRRSIHMARFEWIGRQLAGYQPGSYDIVELGCFDGRVLNHCPAPRRYFGVDANWEGGLDQAKARFSQNKGWDFVESTSPADFDALPDKSFDVGISLETLEHIDPEAVEAYVAQLARVVRGRLYVTVPNEKGAVFLLKRTAKLLMGHKLQPYTFGEWIKTIFGRTSTVSRDGHKGFDYMWLADILSQHSKIVSIKGISRMGMPAWASVTVAIVAEPAG